MGGQPYPLCISRSIMGTAQVGRCRSMQSFFHLRTAVVDISGPMWKLCLCYCVRTYSHTQHAGHSELQELQTPG